MKMVNFSLARVKRWTNMILPAFVGPNEFLLFISSNIIFNSILKGRSTNFDLPEKLNHGCRNSHQAELDVNLGNSTSCK